MHNSLPQTPAASGAIGKAKVGKTDVRHWLKRVEKLAPRDGYQSPFFSVQIAHRGRRMRFPLETANKEAAAGKAQRIYLSLLSVGWEKTLVTFKPQTAKPTQTATIGELAAEIRSTAGFRPSTFSVYLQALRLIASQIADIGDPPALDESGSPINDKKGRPVLLSRFDYRSGGRDAWATLVNALRLDVFTPAAIQKWKLAYLERAGNAPDARRRASNSVNAHLRNARSLFSEKALKHVHAKLLLPDPLPFVGVKLEKRGSTRYISRLDARQILTDARTELASDPARAQQFRIFCLALLCGLRKREIDSLLWRQVDFSSAQIRIEATEYFQPKSEDSIAAVDVDEELLALLRGWKAQNKGEFVIESANPPRYHVSRVNYRCEKDFLSLYAWLGSKGITARKKLHELRKELGAVLASEHGIFAAQQMLRHADIRTTQQFYADKKKRISAGFGSLLTECAGASPAAASVRASRRAKQQSHS